MTTTDVLVSLFFLGSALYVAAKIVQWIFAQGRLKRVGERLGAVAVGFAMVALWILSIGLFFVLVDVAADFWRSLF